MARQRGNVALVDLDTGALLPPPRPRTPHSMDGHYTLNAYTEDVPLYSLSLSGSEWSVIDWIRSNGGAAGPVKVMPGDVAPDLRTTETTVKTSLARLVRLNSALKTSPRSSTYQLNPRRFWEGSGDAQVAACLRLDPPPIIPDSKALKATAKKAATGPKAAAGVSGPRRVVNGEQHDR